MSHPARHFLAERIAVAAPVPATVDVDRAIPREGRVPGFGPVRSTRDNVQGSKIGSDIVLYKFEFLKIVLLKNTELGNVFF